MRTFEDPEIRRARARSVAERAEAECVALQGRPDLLLRAALHRHAAGDVDLAREHAAALLARAEDDPAYAPSWITRRAHELLVLIDRDENGGQPVDPVAPRAR